MKHINALNRHNNELLNIKPGGTQNNQSKDVHSLHSSWEEHVLQLFETKGSGENEMGHGGVYIRKKSMIYKAWQLDRQTDRRVFVLQLTALVPC
jgi:hypothetical protein